MNSLVQASNAWLVDFHLAATLLLLVVLIAMRFIKQPARRLSIAWAAVLGLPVLTLAVAVPCWPVVSLVSQPVASIEPQSMPVAEEVLGMRRNVEPNVEPVWDAHDEGESASPVQLPNGGMETPARSEQSPADAVTAAPSVRSRIGASGPLLFLALFASGSVACIVWLALGVVQASVICRSANVAPPELLAELKALVGCKRRTPRLLISSRVQNPVAVGLIRPTILLPERLACEGITPGLRAALAHEWTHIRSKDLWLLAICRNLRLILFAHPLFWLLQRSIRADQEVLADAAAADTTGPIAYAEALLRWAHHVIDAGDTRLAPLLGLWERPSRSQLARRIAMLLNEELRVDRRVSRRWTSAWSVVLVLSAAGLPCFTLRPADAVSPSDVEGVEGADPLPKHLDRYGDPLPKKAILRLGTRRLRHRGRPYCVAFSPDGRTMATCGDSENQGVSLWGVRSGRLIRQLPLCRTTAAIAFSPDGLRCLAAEAEGGLHLWDCRTGKKNLTLESDGHRIGCVAFAADGSLFATGGGDGFVRVRHAESGDQRFAFDTGERQGIDASNPFGGSDGGPCSVAFSPDGRFLVSGTEEAKVHVIDLATGKGSLRIKQAHKDGLTSLAITSDGKQVITGGYRRFGVMPYVDGQGRMTVETNVPNVEIRFWDVATGKKIREFSYEGSFLGWGDTSLSADARRLASSSRNSICIWDVDSGTILREIPTRASQDVHGVTISPDGRIVARARHHSVDLWEVDTGKPLLQGHESHVASVGSVAYSPDGSLIASGGEDGVVHLWDAKTGEHTGQHHLIDPSSSVEHEGIGPMHVVYSPDSKKLAVGGEVGPFPHGRFIKLFNKTNGELIGELPGPSTGHARVARLAFGPDGMFALAAGDDIDVWFIKEEGTKAGELRPAHWPRDIVALAFLDFRKLCEVRSKPPTIRVWDWAGRTTREIEVHGHWSDLERRLQQISDAVFSPDRRQVITCGEDKLITWDLETGKPVSSLTLGRPSEERRIGLSPDGRMMAVVAPSYLREDGDGTIRLWDLTAGKQVLTLQPENARAMSFAFSPDGRRLVTGMDTGTALVWDISDAYGG